MQHLRWKDVSGREARFDAHVDGAASQCPMPARHLGDLGRRAFPPHLQLVSTVALGLLPGLLPTMKCVGSGPWWW